MDGWGAVNSGNRGGYRRSGWVHKAEQRPPAQHRGRLSACTWQSNYSMVGRTQQSLKDLSSRSGANCAQTGKLRAEVQRGEQDWRSRTSGRKRKIGKRQEKPKKGRLHVTQGAQTPLSHGRPRGASKACPPSLLPERLRLPKFVYSHQTASNTHQRGSIPVGARSLNTSCSVGTHVAAVIIAHRCPV